MKKSFLLLTFILIFFAIGYAQMPQPVKWSANLEKSADDASCTVTLTATIDQGWHLYGFDMPEDGPVSTSISFAGSTGVKAEGRTKASPRSIKAFDDMFEAEVSWWENQVTFTRTFTITDAENAQVKAEVRYMSCNDANCMPPKTETFTLKAN